MKKTKFDIPEYIEQEILKPTLMQIVDKKYKYKSLEILDLTLLSSGICNAKIKIQFKNNKEEIIIFKLFFKK
jgi:hypothetical protein